MRWLFLSHRYLGIALGVLMAMWCLSGFVMMYVSYPEMPEELRLQALESIDWGECCTIDPRSLEDTDQVARAEIEMLAEHPVLRVTPEVRGKTKLIDLQSGLELPGVSEAQALRVAMQLGRSGGHWDLPQYEGLIDYDQWTVSGARFDRPFYHFSIDDRDQTELYVSSTTGKIVQLTTAHERFWNYLGAIPHWLYFSRLRHNGLLWSQVVIYTSLTGCFLALTGLYLGVRQFLRRPRGRWSGYRGIKLWHHVPGVLFGLFALTWVASGLLSMNPWGLLEGSGSGAERALLHGGMLTGLEVKNALQRLSAHPPVGEFVSIESAPLLGRLYLVTTDGAGARRRLDDTREPAPLSAEQVQMETHLLAGDRAVVGPELITRADEYYFSHHREVALLPAYRITVEDGARYYLDPVNGLILAKIDRDAKGYRWLHQALHRMDFIAARPAWDVLMLVLLSGATLVCVTGAYMGLRSLFP